MSEIRLLDLSREPPGYDRAEFYAAMDEYDRREGKLTDPVALLRAIRARLDPLQYMFVCSALRERIAYKRWVQFVDRPRWSAAAHRRDDVVRRPMPRRTVPDPDPVGWPTTTMHDCGGGRRTMRSSRVGS